MNELTNTQINKVTFSNERTLRVTLHLLRQILSNSSAGCGLDLKLIKESSLTELCVCVCVCVLFRSFSTALNADVNPDNVKFGYVYMRS